MMRKQLTMVGLSSVLFLSACAEMNPVQRGTATGAGIGAGAGAVIGAATGDGGGRRAAKGAALGGVAGAVIGNIWTARMERQKQVMEQATRGTGIEVTQTADNRLKLDIPTDISFDVNRANIKPELRPILDRFASTLTENPTTAVTIVGHTDSTGSDAVNNPLSVNRASQTRQYLVSRGVSPDRFQIDGRGSYEPIASNTSESGRSQNRRVEIYVAEQQAMAPGQGRQYGGYGSSSGGGYGTSGSSRY